MKILVTGGSGFIGTAVLNALLKTCNAEITVFDKNQPSLMSGVSFIRGSVNDEVALDEAIKGSDVVIHLAAMLGVSACQNDIKNVVETNIISTLSLIESCKRHNIKKLLFSSSSEIYGDPPVDKYTETDLPLPRTPYGMSKTLSEGLIENFANKEGVFCRVVRFFNVYGPNQRPDFVIQKFIKAALNGEPVYVYGSGKQTRTFTYIEDAAKGLIDVLFKSPEAEGNFDIFNIGSNETTTIRELADQVLKLAGASYRAEYMPYDHPEMDRSQKFEIYNRIPNIDKAKAAFNYQPQTSLEAGLLKTISWFKSLQKAA